MKRATGLDGMRGVASLGVFAVHIWMYAGEGTTRPIRDNALGFAIFEIRLVVPFFFVLSAFLLYRYFARVAVRGGEVDVGLYLRRRVARILPAYYLAMAGTMLLVWGSADKTGARLPPAGDLPLYAFFAQNYSTGTILRLNPATWTLSIEVAFYSLLPLFGLAGIWLARRGLRAHVWFLASLIPLGVAWNALVYFAGWGMVPAKALPAYIPYFAMGMLLCLWLERRAAAGTVPRLDPGRTAALAGGGFALVVLNGVWHALASADGHIGVTGIFGDIPAGAGFAAIVAAVLLGRGPSVAWLRVPQLVQMGVISYGFYLWHLPLILFAKRIEVLPGDFLGAALLTLPPAIAFGAASWVLIERPLLRRAARRRPPTPVPALEPGAAQ